MIQKTIDDKKAATFRNLLETSEHVVVTCHVRPDGDAMGSSLGLYHLLRALGKNVKVITPDMPPRQLGFMPGMNDVVVYTKYQDYTRRLMSEADLIVCCDFNRISRQELLGELLAETTAAKVLIDHHLDPEPFADLTFSFPEMSSASEVVFRLIAAMGLYTAVDLDAATCLCTGIITDTKNLSVNCNNPELYLVMLELMKKGVDKVAIVKKALHTHTLNSTQLHAHAMLNNLKVFHRHCAALVWLTAEDLERFNYEKGDSEGIVDKASEISGVVYSIFLREDSDCIKVSTRSSDDFPVNEICEKYFEGGGHRMAAGGKFKGSIKDCIHLCETIMPEFDKYLPGKIADEASDEEPSPQNAEKL